MHASDRRRARQQARVRPQGAGLDSHGFFNLLTGPQSLDQVESSLPEHRGRLFPPTEARSMFLAQVMNADRSCQAAVNRSALAPAVGGLPPCRASSGGYCRARQRLLQDMISGLTRYIRRQVSADTLQPWRWQDRSVKLVDGTTVTLPDIVEQHDRGQGRIVHRQNKLSLAPVTHGPSWRRPPSRTDGSRPAESGSPRR